VARGDDTTVGFPGDPGGEQAAPVRGRPWGRRAAGIAGIAGIAGVVGLLGFALRPAPGRRALPSAPAARARPAIAVLPFVNRSRDAAQDYVADGLTEALTTDLSEIGGLKVVSRASTEPYRATAKPLPEIAAELGVDDLLSGSVLREGDHLRISARLVEARSGRTLWEKGYDRTMSDIPALQCEVSQEIARETQVQLTSRDQARLARAHAVRPEVYDDYLRGRYQWNRRNLDGMGRAISYFAQAIAKDPNYAPAYAGLADSYNIAAILRGTRQTIPQARAAAQKALELDETLPEAHASLGVIHLLYDWDWGKAETELRRALELNPNYATAHQWYWVELAALGRLPEAQREIELARELDPLSLVIEGAYAEQLFALGRRTAWETEVRKIQKKEPSYLPLLLDLAQVAAAEGRPDEACRQYQAALGARHLGDVALEMERARGAQGSRAALEQGAKSLAAQTPVPSIPKTEIAWLFAAAGDRDQAFEWLEKALQERTTQLLWLGISPEWENLRADPRYADLLRRMGLRRAEKRPRPAGWRARPEPPVRAGARS
jgi:TolB-like protein/tetratricopeptide (TPR) repeat protein